MKSHGIFWSCCLLAVTFAHEQNLYRLITRPEIPKHYPNATIGQTDASSIKECSMQCNIEVRCQAAVLDTSNHVCLLYKSSMINVTRSVCPNDLIYLEDVCATSAVKRPNYCPEPAPLTTQPQIPVYQDCQEFYENGYSTDGVYTINITGSGLDPFDVWCDFFDDHGWTTIQKRFDGSVDFYVYWSDYKNGFGNVSGEHWMGNDRIHALTQTNQKLNIYLEAADCTYRNGYWTQFYIADESDKYRLTVTADGYTGDAEEQLTAQHNGLRFSTRDNDNDNSGGECAEQHSGAWWYNSCYIVCLNGIYTTDGVSHSTAAGVNWCCSWKGHQNSLLKTTMRVTRD